MSSHRTPVRLAVAVACSMVVPTLVACGSATPDRSSTSAPAPANRPLLDLAALDSILPVPADQATEVLVETSRAAADDLLVHSGITEVIPDAADLLVVLDAALEEQSAEAIPGSAAMSTGGPEGLRRNLAAAPSGASGPPAQLATNAAAFGVKTLAVGVIAGLEQGANGEPINQEFDVDVRKSNGVEMQTGLSLVGGSAKVRLVQRATESTASGDLSVTSDLRATLDACPTADGLVNGTFAFEVQIDAVSGTGRAGGRYTMEVELSATVDDTATLVGSEVRTTGSAAEHSPSSEGETARIDGWFVEGGSRMTMGGRGSSGLELTGLDEVELTRASTGADEATASSFIENQAKLAAFMAVIVLRGAEAFWRGGACVDVQMLTAGDPKMVQAGEEVPVAIEATSASDGLPIGAPATAVATAEGGTVAPSGTAQQLTSTVVYSVPAEGDDGSVEAVVTSRRGIGTGTLRITTPRALVVDGALDVFHARGTKCGGPSGEWELALSADFQGYPFTGVLRFDVSPTTREGTYTLTGSTSGGGITVDQSGSGTVRVAAGPNGVQLVFSGTAWTGGPDQVLAIEATRVIAADC